MPCGSYLEKTVSTYIVATPIKYKGVVHKPDARIELPDAVARDLVVSGAVLVAALDPKPAQSDAGTQDAPTGGSDGEGAAGDGQVGETANADHSEKAQQTASTPTPPVAKKTASPRKTAAKKAARKST